MTFCIVDKLRASELIDALNFDRTVLRRTCLAIKLRALDGQSRIFTASLASGTATGEIE